MEDIELDDSGYLGYKDNTKNCPGLFEDKMED